MTEAAPLGLGLVGCGRFGTRVAEACARLGAARVVAVADPDGAARSLLALRCQARAYTDEAALLSDGEVQAVAVAAPPAAHGSLGMMAGRARRHVFMAEPLAIDLGRAEVMVKGFHAEKLQLHVYAPLRFVSVYRLLRVVLKTGTLGAPTWLGVERHYNSRAIPTDHWSWDPKQSGGFLQEHGTHFFDLARHLLGAPAVTVAAVPHTARDGTADGALVNVQYQNDAVGSFFFAFPKGVVQDRTVVRIHFERGTAELTGFIPDHLDLQGVPDEAAAKLGGLLGKDVEVLAAPPVPRASVPADGPALADAPVLRIRLGSDSGIPPEHETLCSALSAFARAVSNPLAPPPVTPADALESLRLAVKAQAAMDQKVMLRC